MRQRRSVGARRVRPLHRLVELLRIAEQHEILGGARDRDRVGEGDLAGFVDEQRVDRPGHLRRDPQPRRPGGEVRAAVAELAGDVAGVLGAHDSIVGVQLVRVGVLDRSHDHALLIGRLEDLAEQVADDLVTRSP